MPILIVMNKPYNDDGALRTVIDYVARGGYGYCGGYAANPRYAFEEMQLVKNLWGERPWPADQALYPLIRQRGAYRL